MERSYGNANNGKHFISYVNPSNCANSFFRLYQGMEQRPYDIFKPVLDTVSCRNCISKWKIILWQSAHKALCIQLVSLTVLWDFRGYFVADLINLCSLMDNHLG